MRHLLVMDLLSGLNIAGYASRQKSHEYLEWINSDLVNISEEFARKNRLTESCFIKVMNNIFKTSRFELLLKRWLVEYFLELFRMLDCSERLTLEDNPLNRFGAERYLGRFNALPEIKWEKQSNLLSRILAILLRAGFIFYFSLNNGIKMSGKIKKYKVMREAIWGLYDSGGYYFHDDFLVDGNKIKKEDLLLFSRGMPHEEGRLRGYRDAKKSGYAHFNLSSLSIGAKAFFSRIAPKYAISSSGALFLEIFSPYFSLYWSVYLSFIYNALPYERVFSNFKIVSELGHNYFSTSHISEAIVCQNYGVKYYLMHWSDNSINTNKYVVSFLGCDGFLVWGKAHVRGIEGPPEIIVFTGYVFKRFVKEVMSDRTRILSDMGINAKGKIISFLDESFGGNAKMTGENYVNFWETALKAAETGENTILIKPKAPDIYKNLPDDLRQRFIEIKAKITNLPNAYIVSPDKWSFIEVIGVSDIVITQGMTSSATIAIICGIEGLYLDQAGYKHVFSANFKNKVVFNEPEKLLNMINKIIKGDEYPCKKIPEELLRQFDEYSDDRGIDLFRDILTSSSKRIGIIIQARMSSERLPGKVMLPLEDKAVLQHIVERLKDCRKVNEIILATTEKKDDNVIVRLAQKNGLKVFRGSESDVLSRYYYAAKENRIDIIIRITSDCPLIDPEIADKMIELYLEKRNIDYLSNTLTRTFPRGLDIEIFNFQALERAFDSAKEPYQREHVTPYIYENSEIFSMLNYSAAEDNSKYRLTIDTVEDYEFIREIYRKIYTLKPKFRLGDIISLLKKEGDIFLVNAGVKQKEIKEAAQR